MAKAGARARVLLAWESATPLARAPQTGDSSHIASANLELARSIYAAWESGDFSSFDWAHPEIEYVIADGPTPGRWTGQAGLWGGFRDFASAWEELHVEATEYRELGDERVLVLTRLSGRGKTSGMELEQMRAEGADLLHVRGGKVTRFVLYHDRQHAFADLGLAPEAGSQHS